METTPVMIGMTLYSRYLEDIDLNKDEDKKRMFSFRKKGFTLS